MRRQERLREERRVALVDGCRAHLHRGSRADVGADDDPVDALERERGDLLGPRSGEVEPCRPSGSSAAAPRSIRPRRRPSSAERVGDLRDGGRRDRVQVGEERCAAGARARRADVAGDCPRLLRRHDREHDVRITDDRSQVVQELERRFPAASRRVRFASAGDRCDDRVPPRKGVPHRGTHRSGADDGDGRHESSGRPVAVTWAATASHRSVATAPRRRVATRAGAAVRERVRRPAVDDRDVPEDADVDVVRLEVRDRHRASRSARGTSAIDERAVGVRAQEVVGERRGGRRPIPAPSGCTPG